MISLRLSRWISSVIAVSLICIANLTAPALIAGEGKPLLLNADEMTFNRELGVITASGNVELYHDDRMVTADMITYNQKTKIVAATGNIRMIEPDGHIMFADYAQLTDDMAQAFVKSVRILLTDNSRLAANEGERVDDGRYMRLDHAVFSPCDLCESDPTKPPLWQIKAVRVIHDGELKDIVYHHATMEMFGVPVGYVPYFSHPDPTVKRRSGFLSPTFGTDGNYGSFLGFSYYFDLAPNSDLTVDALGMTTDGLMLGGHLRHRFERGQISLKGSGIITDQEVAPNVFLDDVFRGYIIGTGEFHWDENFRSGFDIYRTSDDDFLRRYDLDTEDILTSRAWTEYFEGRQYGLAEIIDYQDLRPSITLEEPIVAPHLFYEALGNPASFLGGRWSIGGEFISLSRPGTSTDMQRASATVGWHAQRVHSSGVMASLDASLRGDAYYVTDFVPSTAPAGAAATSNTKFRAIPQLHGEVSYPLMRQGDRFSQIIEPVASLSVAPNLDNRSDFSNEDSLDIELDETSLMRPNRYPGVDRYEGGTHLAYGVRARVYDFGVPGPGILNTGGGSATAFFGQSYRLKDDSTFPTASGLEENFSDYVGSITLEPNSWLDLNYGFRLDRDDFTPRRHELRAMAGQSVFRPQVHYLYLDESLGTSVSGGTEEVTFGFSSQVTDHWSTYASHRYNLDSEDSITTSLGLNYNDECFTFQLTGLKDHTVRSDVDDSFTAMARLVFKHLGEIDVPVPVNALDGRKE